MARLTGETFPERRLMGLISDLLGIPHLTTAKGSKVRKDYVEAVASALGLDTTGMSKDDLTLACIATAQRRPRDPSYLSRAGTVTNVALRAIYDGLVTNGLPSGSRPVAAAAAEEGEEEDIATSAFDPAAVVDERDRRLRQTAVREGQDTFRAAVLEAYGHRCAMTGADVSAGLDAAHIVPYRGSATNLVVNGLALRADVHRLFDRGQVGVDASTLQVHVKPVLLTTVYGGLEGHLLRLPVRHPDHPSPAALEHHWRWAGFAEP